MLTTLKAKFWLPSSNTSSTSSTSNVAPVLTHTNTPFANNKRLSNIIKAGPTVNHEVYNQATDWLFASDNSIFREKFFNESFVQRRSLKAMSRAISNGEDVDHRILAALESHTCKACLPTDTQLKLLRQIKETPGLIMNLPNLSKFLSGWDDALWAEMTMLVDLGNIEDYRKHAISPDSIKNLIKRGEGVLFRKDMPKPYLRMSAIHNTWMDLSLPSHQSIMVENIRSHVFNAAELGQVVDALPSFFADRRIVAQFRDLLNSGHFDCNLQAKQRLLEKITRPFIDCLGLASAKQLERLSNYLCPVSNQVEASSLTAAEIYLHPDIVRVAGDGWCYLNSVFSGIILECVDKPEELLGFANNLENIATQISQPATSRRDELMYVIDGLRGVADQGGFIQKQALQLISDELGVISILSAEIGGHIVEATHNSSIQHFCDEFAPSCGVTQAQARNLISRLEGQDTNKIDRLTFFTTPAFAKSNLECVGITIADAEIRDSFIVGLQSIETNITAIKRKTNPAVLDQSMTNYFDDMVAGMGYRAIVMTRETNETVERLQSSIASAKARNEKPLYLRLEKNHYNLLCPNNIANNVGLPGDHPTQKDAVDVSDLVFDDGMPPMYLPGCIVC